LNLQEEDNLSAKGTTADFPQCSLEVLLYTAMQKSTDLTVDRSWTKGSNSLHLQLHFAIIIRQQILIAKE